MSAPEVSTRSRSRRAEWAALGLSFFFAGGTWYLADDDLAVELRESVMTNTATSFVNAKGHVFNQVNGNRATLRCAYSGTTITLGMNGPIRWPNATDGIDVEHTWPSKANWAGATAFKRSSVPGADLHHLFAVRKGINRSRGDKPFGELPVNARHLWVDTDGTLASPGSGTQSGRLRDENANGTIVFEPRADHKGNVARAMFYMSVRYWWPIPDAMEADLRRWNVSDPVDAAERARNERIHGIQGNRNPFILNPEYIDRISDFEE